MNAAVEKIIEQLQPLLIEEYAKSMIGDKAEKLVAAGQDPDEIIKEFKKSIGGSTSFTNGLKGLGNKITLLLESTVDFATRLATVPLAIIGAGTTGPTISVNLILPLIKQLQGEGRNLAQIYEDVTMGLESFQIDKLAAGNTVIGGIYTAITAVLSTAAIAISIVGIKCGNQEAQDTSEYEKSPLSVDATTCKEYSTTQEYASQPKEGWMCTKFKHIQEKTLEDFGGDSEKYEEWRKENAKTVDDFQDSPEKGTKEAQYLEWLKENHLCKYCKNFKSNE